MGEDISISKLHRELDQKFSSLQCDLKCPPRRQRGGGRQQQQQQFCIMISPKNIVALEDPTPKFFVLIQESTTTTMQSKEEEKPVLELKLLTFHGKNLRTEIHATESDLLMHSKILHSFDQGEFKVCQGMNDVSCGGGEHNREEILLEYFLDNVVLRSRSCEFLLYNRDSELCAECGQILLINNREQLRPSSKLDDVKEEIFDGDDQDDDDVSDIIRESLQMEYHETRLKEECDGLVLVNGESSLSSESRQQKSSAEKVDYQEEFNDTNTVDYLPEGDDDDDGEECDDDEAESDFDEKIKRNKGRKKRQEIKSTKSKKSPKKPLLQCESCDKCYKSNLSYAKHIKVCKSEESSGSIVESLRCQVCLLTLGSQHTFNSHMEQHKLKMTVEGDTGCPRCKKMCQKLELNSHFQSDHDRTKGVCILCKTICSASFLEKHMKRKHFWKKHLCPECGREFDQLMKLSIHQATAHGTNEAPVVCDQCGKQFPHKERLRQHVGFFHKNSGNGEKPTCKYCGKAFASFHAMYKHKKTHSKVKPFQCRFCDYRAVFRSNVGVHLRKVHKQLDAKKEDVIRVGNFEYGDEEFPVSHDKIRPDQVPLSATPSHPGLAAIDLKMKPDLNPD